MRAYSCDTQSRILLNRGDGHKALPQRVIVLSLRFQWLTSRLFPHQVCASQCAICKQWARVLSVHIEYLLDTF